MVEIIIKKDKEAQRIDNFLRNHWKGVPKSRIYRALRRGEVRVNRRRVKADYRLKEQDCLRLPPLRLPKASDKPQPPKALLAQMQASVLLEDERLLILNKPSGLPVHGGSGIDFAVVESLRVLYPQLSGLSLAHRLDRGTSGCLLLAKNAGALKVLHDLFRQHRVQKNYLAWVAGSWQLADKNYQHFLAPERNAQGERVVKVAKEGQESTTYFRLIARYQHLSLIEARPKTGRMHQIRVQCAALGHPILGDAKYGDYALNRLLKKQLKLKHTLLHAASLLFDLQQERYAISAPLPAAFKQLQKNIKTLDPLLKP